MVESVPNGDTGFNDYDRIRKCLQPEEANEVHVTNDVEGLKARKDLEEQPR